MLRTMRRSEAFPQQQQGASFRDQISLARLERDLNNDEFNRGQAETRAETERFNNEVKLARDNPEFFVSQIGRELQALRGDKDKLAKFLNTRRGALYLQTFENELNRQLYQPDAERTFSTVESGRRVQASDIQGDRLRRPNIGPDFDAIGALRLNDERLSTLGLDAVTAAAIGELAASKFRDKE